MKRRWLLPAIPLIFIVAGTGLSRLHAAPTSYSGAIAITIGRSATISVAPGRADAENTFMVGGITAPAVRILSRSLGMAMGVTTYTGAPMGDGRWRVSNVEVPMVGRWGIEVQARNNRTWVTVGDIVYQVPFTGRMSLAHPPL